jgi:selenium-dependent xanthine dehydrogenase
MIKFELNGSTRAYAGDPGISLLSYLRDGEGITSVKDGCSGQAACGACLLEMNGQPVLACVTPMKKVSGAKVVTIEGFPAGLRETLGRAFVAKGAVQCGFCTPGFLSRAKILLETHPDPGRAEIIKALRFNLCRCTGYVKIIEAVELAAKHLAAKKPIVLEKHGRIGKPQPKYDAYSRAVGTRFFVDDIRVDRMLHGALKFSDHPRARVVRINASQAARIPGVIRVFTGRDIPGKRHVGVIRPDWPVMVVEGETTRYIGDVLAGVVAETETIARRAAARIEVDYEVLEPLTDLATAEDHPVKIHRGGNLLHRAQIQRGDDIDAVLAASAHVAQGVYKTQRVEHGFLEPEAVVAAPLAPEGVELHSQSQGVYEDRRQVASILGIDESRVIVNLVPSGGAFGGKEDLTVQGHAALFCHHLKRPVKLKLSRDESIRMHPKRHPMQMHYRLGCDHRGRLTGLSARIVGDTGAYASLGAEVLARAASHASAAYYVPHVDIDAKAVYTNNIPSGAMRGFGVNQVTFAMEGCIDQLCESGGFDRWQFRYENALKTGDRTASGQVLGAGVGLRETLLAVREDYERADCAGLACGLKNCGIGNGVLEECEVGIDIVSGTQILLQHGWTEMGQGVDTVAQQILCEETGLEDPGVIEVKTSTRYRAVAGMTTASRATFMLGKAIIDAAAELRADLETGRLSELAGRSYRGAWRCDWTTGAADTAEPKSHYAYGYATHLVILDDRGKVDTVVAAHDGGRIINPTLFEGQIEGAVVMGLGYALTEELRMDQGRLAAARFGRLGIPRIKDTPTIIVKGIEVPDPLGPYGAKGVGEIGNIPTAAATANALFQFDGVRRFELPMKRKGSGGSG